MDIPNVDYKYESLNNECSKLPITTFCDYQYIKSNGVIKCATETDCLNLKYEYLLGTECKSSCNDNYYKLKDGSFTKCFQTYIDCKEGGTGPIYYNERSKQCWKSFQNGYFINNRDIANNIYELVDECENFYYENSGDLYRYYCSIPLL